MDKAIDQKKINRKKRKRILIGIGLFFTTCLLIYYLIQLFSPKISRDDLVISQVQRGNIEEVLSAEGKVEPFNETVVVSPFSGSIEGVFQEAGAQLVEGQPIIQLNTDLLQLQYEQLNQELQLKNNNVSKLALELDKNLAQLQIDYKIKELEVKNFQSAVDRMQKLHEIGGETKEALNRSLQELQIAQFEKNKLESEIRYKRASYNKEMSNENIQSNLQRQKRNEISRMINLATVKSPTKGVLTWVEDRLGLQVAEGAEIAKIADISSYALMGKISERYSNQIFVGMKALVNQDSIAIQGKIEQIYPTIENNSVSFKVLLDTDQSQSLKPNQQLPISLVLGEKTNVLYVDDGPVFNSAKTAKVYVVKGDKAYLKEVQLGLQSGGKVEIASGLNQGDSIIISNTDSYNNTPEIRLK